MACCGPGRRWHAKRHHERPHILHELVEVCLVFVASLCAVSVVLAPSPNLALGLSLVQAEVAIDGGGTAQLSAGVFGAWSDDALLQLWAQSVLDTTVTLRRLALGATIVLALVSANLVNHHLHALHFRHSHEPHSRFLGHVVVLLLAIFEVIAYQRVGVSYLETPTPQGYKRLGSGYGSAMLVSVISLCGFGFAFVLSVAHIALHVLSTRFAHIGHARDDSKHSFNSAQDIELVKSDRPRKGTLTAEPIVESPKALEAGLSGAPEGPRPNIRLTSDSLDKLHEMAAAPPSRTSTPSILPIVKPLAPKAFRQSNRPPPLRKTSLATLRPPRRQASLAFEASLQSPAVALVPLALRQGVPMLKVSAKRVRRATVRIVPEEGRLLWDSVSKDRGVLDMENVRELRFGAEAIGRDQRRVGLSEADERRSILLIYCGVARRVQALHIIALDDASFAPWREALTKLHASRRALLGGLDQMRRREVAWLRQVWRAADTDADERIDLQEALALCRKLGLVVPQAQIEAHFDMADSQHQHLLDKSDFRAFVQQLKRRPDVERIMRRAGTTVAGLTQDDFIAFMRASQSSPLSQDELVALHIKFAHHQTGLMDADGLTAFLTSTDNAITADQVSAPAQDMTRPLCDYFISSSHNTYLVGSQYRGESTIEGYVRALQDGCRSVEIDLWDGPHGLPIVTHGRTLTSKITAHDVFSTIARYAFVASPYPVVLSLESHLSAVQQDRLVETLRATLGSALVDEPVSSLGFPSPEDLKFRFLIKSKLKTSREGLQRHATSPIFVVTQEGDDAAESDSDGEHSVYVGEQDGIAPPTPRSPMRSPTAPTASAPVSPGMPRSATMPILPPPKSSSLMVPQAGLGGVLQRTRSLSLSRRTSTAPIMSSAFASLLIYTRGTKYRGFPADYNVFDTISLKEGVAAKALKRNGPALRAHARTHLVRSYPAPSRVTSSNYAPHDLWASGIQLVALNLQTFDLCAEMHAAFFARSGGCGYVLKPSALLSSRGPRPSIRHTLTVDLISAQQLAPIATDHTGDALVEPDIRPSISAAVYAPGAAISKAPSHRTATVSNSFNPLFDETAVLPFDCSPDLLDMAFLEIRVHGDRSRIDGIIGRACLPVGALLPGYRTVPLYDHLGVPLLHSTVFVRIALVAEA